MTRHTTSMNGRKFFHRHWFIIFSYCFFIINLNIFKTYQFTYLFLLLYNFFTNFFFTLIIESHIDSFWNKIFLDSFFDDRFLRYTISKTVLNSSSETNWIIFIESVFDNFSYTYFMHLCGYSVQEHCVHFC